MGLLDRLRAVLGTAAEADATSDADPEDLFGLSTAYVTMEAELDYAPAGEAALCFSDVDSTAFREARDEVDAVLHAGERETGTRFEFRTDTHGYEWVVLADEEFEDLVTSVHFAADTMVEGGFGSRLLAAVFAFRGRDRTAYWIYSFRRGSFYPFVPAGQRAEAASRATRERDSATEFKLESVLGGELAVEDDESYWYPLWPEGDAYPWGEPLASG
jgi:hypothetical protein